ncbi:homeodomain-interacting protein kinase 1-like [Cynoglossus semilaevis]|uniref:homeodomain-interacting protein kinase 1-like n=1 Tax=Cynoglossus semilaevis TaxID=244447 RepID=UPI000494F895|nr:homeodomain-interacting protein kinase 1-like [Cynoglossus semilaevis]
MDPVACERQQDVTTVCPNEDQDFKVKIEDLITSSCTDYQVQTVLGCGAYGLVTQCLKMSTRETVALKIFTKKQSTNDAQEEEAILKTMKALNSDRFNVISLKNSFIYRGHYCLEFEKLDMTLRDFLKKKQAVSLQLEEIRPILHQLAIALDFLKGAKVIHADLKPENVMMVDHVQQPLKVKIIDLGLAIGNRGESRGWTLQSLWYRSPEVLLGAPVSEAIDVWSLGCISAELLMGIPLFDCNNKYDLMRHIVCMMGKPPAYLLKAGLFTRLYRLKTKVGTTLCVLTMLACQMFQQ